MMRTNRSFLLAALILLGAVSCQARGVRFYKAEVVKEYPHDVSSYTQGLFFHKGKLIETTGQYGESTLREVDIQSGKALRKVDFNKKYFVEGSVVLDGKLFILTWTNKVAFVYDPETFSYKATYSYPRQGWGLTTDGKSLIASDGSSRLYFLTPEFRQEKVIDVNLNGKPIRYLNELEWIDGRIWANVYTTDMILVINPSNGDVEKCIDCSGILPEALRTKKTDVLNGIAINPEDGRIYITGKYWPRLYEITLAEHK